MSSESIYKCFCKSELSFNFLYRPISQGVNGLLESPTGTGKTLCLLCSSLGWLATRKAQIQSGMQAGDMGMDLKNQLSSATGFGWGDSPTAEMGAPKIIYASRTHSQLSQVVSELKRSSYRYMKVSHCCIQM